MRQFNFQSYPVSIRIRESCLIEISVPINLLAIRDPIRVFINIHTNIMRRIRHRFIKRKHDLIICSTPIISIAKLLNRRSRPVCKDISRSFRRIECSMSITSFNHLINRLNNRPVNLNLLNKMHNIRLSVLDQTQHPQKQYGYSTSHKIPLLTLRLCASALKILPHSVIVLTANCLIPLGDSEILAAAFT